MSIALRGQWGERGDGRRQKPPRVECASQKRSPTLRSRRKEGKATAPSTAPTELSIRIAHTEQSGLRWNIVAEGCALLVLLLLAAADRAGGSALARSPGLAAAIVVTFVAWSLQWFAHTPRRGALRRYLSFVLVTGEGAAVASYALGASPYAPLIPFALCSFLCLACLRMDYRLVLYAGLLYALELAAVGWLAVGRPTRAGQGGPLAPHVLWLSLAEWPILVLLVALLLARLAWVAARLVRQQARADEERDIRLGALRDRLEAMVGERTATLQEAIAAQAALSERGRIARRLHDGLAKSVAGLSLDLDQWRAEAADLPPQVAERIRHLSDAARQMVAQAREAVSEARQPVDRPCLLTELRAEALRFSAWSGIAVDVECAARLPDLPPSVTEEICQIVAEALTNLAHHAAASHARIRIECTADATTLTVDDDGVGLDFRYMDETGHYGLLGMRERARQIQARIEWLGRGPLGGASVRIRIPRHTMA